jgi:hypothetical protein
MRALADDWFFQIESAVTNQYTLLKLKGDIDNSVLAGFVLSDSDRHSLRVIAIGTGTKLLSGDLRETTSAFGPVLLHDCHAEVLAHRGLEAWIWDQLDSLFQARVLPQNLSLHFYSSTPPCGDCCVHELPGGISVQTGAKPFGWDQHELAGSPPNYVRGKPGRGSRSQSVSCSDKIYICLNAGLEGSILSRFVDKLAVKSVCIGDGVPESCERAFYRRVRRDVESTILVGKSQWEQKNESPSACSFVWWDGAERGGEMVSAKCGRRMGVIEKRQTDPRSWPRVSDAAMLERYCTRASLGAASLDQAKDERSGYRARKEDIKRDLVRFGGAWCTKFPAERVWVWQKASP